MYEEIFRSKARPFRATPDANFYFAHNSIEAARQATLQAVARAAGPALILGGAGLGKSMLCRVLAQDLNTNYDIVNLVSARLSSREELLQGILFELQLPYKQLSEGELRLAILDHLQPESSKASEGIVILVDEAQYLSLDLLDELRLISNFTRDNQPRAQVVLFGNMLLEETFSNPEMESFNQRLAARCYLAPMTPGETRAYVEHQLTRASVPVEHFMDQAALDSIFVGSEGVPRVANQLLDHAMLLAASQGDGIITGRTIEEAWSDLQQLPVPWQSKGYADSQEDPAATTQDVQTSEVETESIEPANSAIEGLLDKTAESNAPESNNTFVELPDLDVLADEIANAQRVSYEVEFGQLEDELQEETQAEIANDSAEENYEEIIGVGLQTPEASVSGYELSCQIEVIDAAAITFDLNEEGLENADRENANSSAIPTELGEPTLVDSDASETLREQETVEESPNFFAAFNPPEEGELPKSIQHALEQPIVEQQSLSETADSIVASDDITSDVEDVDEPAVLPVDSFFSERPTDEKMIAFEQEQAEFQSMGVWENDPPSVPRQVNLQIPRNTSDALMDAFDRKLSGADNVEREEEVNLQPATAYATPNETHTAEIPAATASAESLFGSDFDEELSLEELAQSPSTIASTLEATSSFSTTTDDAEVLPLASTPETAKVTDDASQTAVAEVSQTFEKSDDSSETSEVCNKIAEEPATATEPALEASESSEQTIEAFGIDTAFVSSTFDGDWNIEVANEKQLAEFSQAEEASTEDSSTREPEIQVGKELSADSNRLSELAESQTPSFVPGIMAGSNNTSPVHEEIIKSIPEPQAPTPQAAPTDLAPISEQDDSWSTDVVPVDTARELELQNEIGEMLEQLNFRGIGGFSEEQISSQPQFNAGNTAEELTAATNNAGQYGEQILQAESAAEELFADRTSMYDDDRDMLVIEEEVVRPVTTTAVGTKKTSRTKSYSQLFAKLRQ